MKDLLNLTNLSKREISHILEIASQMRRVTNTKYKKTTQLLGQVIGGLFDNTSQAMPYNLATAYLSGSFVDCSSQDSMLYAEMMDNMGVNAIVVGNHNDNMALAMSKTCKCGIINAGSANSDPIGVLANLMAIYTCLGSLTNLDVAVVGNKDTNTMQELQHCLGLYSSQMVWYLPTEDYTTIRRGIVVDKIDSVFSGADVVVDIGLATYADANKYYNGRYISSNLLDKCRIDVPLLGSKNILSNNNVVEYEHNAVGIQQSCYVSVAMAVLYLITNKL